MVTEKGRKTKWISPEARMIFARSKKNPETGVLKIKIETEEGRKTVLETVLNKETAKRFADSIDETLGAGAERRTIEAESDPFRWKMSKRKRKPEGKDYERIVSIGVRIGEGRSYGSVEFPVDGNGLCELLLFACACAGEKIEESGEDAEHDE